MIKEVTYYDIICDRCGKSFIDEVKLAIPTRIVPKCSQRKASG